MAPGEVHLLDSTTTKAHRSVAGAKESKCGDRPLTRRLQLVTRVENATDALVMAGIGSDGSVERATPRTLWVGVRLR